MSLYRLKLTLLHFIDEIIFYTRLEHIQFSESDRMTEEWTTNLSERKYYALTLCRDLDEISSVVKKVLQRKKGMGSLD